MEESTTYYVITDEQLRALADDTVARTVDGVNVSLQEVGADVAALGESVGGGVVVLDDSQYQEVRGLMGAGVHGSLYVFAALCFLAGFVGIWALVSNWRDK